MSFRQTLDRHLQAIQERDLETLMSTVAQDQILLITPQGEVVLSPDEFARRHREWFESPSWILDVSPVRVVESPALGSATLLLDYWDSPSDTPQRSLLTLIFALRDGAWVMVHDQNTRIQNAAVEARRD